MGMIAAIVEIVIIIAILILVILAEVFLAKKKDKFLGLIIPASSFVISIFILIIIFIYTPASTTTFDQNGVQHSQIIENAIPLGLMIINYLILFFTFNIPTIITFGIYLGYRKKRNNNEKIERMKLQDL